MPGQEIERIISERADEEGERRMNKRRRVEDVDRPVNNIQGQAYRRRIEELVTDAAAALVNPSTHHTKKLVVEKGKRKWLNYILSLVIALLAAGIGWLGGSYVEVRDAVKDFKKSVPAVEESLKAFVSEHRVHCNDVAKSIAVMKETFSDRHIMLERLRDTDTDLRALYTIVRDDVGLGAKKIKELENIISEEKKLTTKFKIALDQDYGKVMADVTTMEIKIERWEKQMKDVKQDDYK